MLCYIKAPINSVLETCMKKKEKRDQKIVDLLIPC